MRRFSVFGVLGLALMALGAAVFYLGEIGEFTLVTEIFDFNSPEIDAAVGVVLFIIGIVVIWATRYKTL
jgi:NADH:ubiquinone oxidoreductase subunit 2 (subunit N)